jgi:1-acyl-sn-glycerol-3-phosphate acyltransferase
VIKDLFRTIATYFTLVFGTIAAAPVVIAQSLGNKEKADPLIRFWARSILRSAGVRVQTRGLEHIPAGHCVMVCNHQSHFDVLVVVSEIKRHIRFVAKAELFKIPLFAQAMRVTDNVKVYRDGAEKDRQALVEAIPAVQERMDLAFFPEGTRSPDGVLKPFKKGAAVLALSAGVPIVPMAVAGTRHVLPKNSLRIHGGRHAALVIGQPISVQGRTLDDRDAITESCRNAVARLLEEAGALAGDA